MLLTVNLFLTVLFGRHRFGFRPHWVGGEVGFSAFLWALLSEVTNADPEVCSVRRDGLCYTLFTFCPAVMFSLAAALTGAVLEAAGYDLKTAVQSARAVASTFW